MMRILTIYTFCALRISTCCCGALGVCDIYEYAGTPCVGAFSTTRALYSSFDGPLYDLKRDTDGEIQSIGCVSPGGVADSTSHDTFCNDTNCTINRIYDQSPKQNHLTVAPGGPWYSPFRDHGVHASRARTTLNGKKVYGAFFEAKMGYRNDNTTGVATGNEPETIYMVADARHFNDKCCFDFGNAEVNVRDDGAGTMEAVYYGTSTGGLFPTHKGTGSGPWVMADLENGLWGGTSTVNPDNHPFQNSSFIVAMVKGNSDSFTLKGGDAQASSAQSLQILFDGPRPERYTPMKKQGAILLGIGGDNSNGGVGTFFEGVLTKGHTTDSSDDDVFINILSAGYGA